MKAPRLYYFSAAEFIRNGVQWFDHMDPRLLILLDTLRHQWGKPIQISAHPRALGREDADSPSWHNVQRWGVCYAADIQPVGIEHVDDARHFGLLAEHLGVTGVGLYPHWNPRPGWHLDVRPDRSPGDPARWGEVIHNGVALRVTYTDALEAMA